MAVVGTAVTSFTSGSFVITSVVIVTSSTIPSELKLVSISISAMAVVGTAVVIAVLGAKSP